MRKKKGKRLVKFDDARYPGVMDPGKVRVGGKYIWLPKSGQMQRVVVIKLPECVQTGDSPDDVVWQCKVRLLESPLPDAYLTALISDLHIE